MTAATTYFIYADEGLVAEMNASGAVVKTYGWIPYGTWGTEPVLMAENGNVYFYHNDHIDTPQKMTDASGAIAWSGTYTLFGDANVESASSITNNLRFSGQYYDSETGAHYNYMRYYDTSIGRYLEPDPTGIDEGTNHLGEFRGHHT